MLTKNKPIEPKPKKPMMMNQRRNRNNKNPKLTWIKLNLK